MICKRAVGKFPRALEFIPDHFKTQMCERVVEKAPWLFIYVLDHLKTQEMRNEAVEEFPF